jgi:hypothetical protein
VSGGRQKRHLNPGPRRQTPGGGVQQAGKLFVGDERQLRAVLRAMEAQEVRRSDPNSSIDDLD